MRFKLTLRSANVLNCSAIYRTSTAHRLALTSSGIWLTAGAEHDIFSDGAIDEIYRFSSGAARPTRYVHTV
ncbi:hypothetical protein [Paenibacillus naphthalenovorans]|uniref:hypothetical protein n=1 Tax=Paenibacillus naphthalenovorans TaxID=162209 RepID=UPI003D28A3DE